MPPFVSLALPVYNGAQFIADALTSILNQDFQSFELIITDNASTDATEAICGSFAARDPRIRYVRHASNLGAGANFNSGFCLSVGQYFKWCAHDDVISTNFLSGCVHILERNPDAVIAYGRLVGIDHAGRPTAYTERELGDLRYTSPAERFRILVGRHGVDAAMFGVHRRTALENSSLHHSYYGSDCALLAELALLGPFVLAPQVTLYNRDHPDRSVNIQSGERLVWQNPSASQRNPVELSSRVRHLVQIAHRHRARAPLFRTLGFLTSWILHPLLLGRLSLELIGFVSPALRTRLRGCGMAALRTSRRLSNFIRFSSENSSK